MGSNQANFITVARESANFCPKRLAILIGLACKMQHVPYAIGQSQYDSIMQQHELSTVIIQRERLMTCL